MKEQFIRTAALLGEDSIRKLQTAHVAVFGIGGVGSYTAEALARAGVGRITVVDADTVEPSNINRQLYALQSTVGERKTAVAARRIKDINSEAEVYEMPAFFDEESLSRFDFSKYDYVVDAIDTVRSKLLLIKTVSGTGVPIISAMGAGNKLDATAFKVADIYKTKVCPLARIIRSECKKLGIRSLKTVYSEEPPVSAAVTDRSGRNAPASAPFVPPVMGFIIAGEVIKDIIGYGK